MTMFGETYARLYDEFHTHKDYASECDLIERAWGRFGRDPITRVLDLGCGTGGHALVLAQRGYTVTGVDQSAAMVRIAAAKAADAGLTTTWIVGDLRAVDAGGGFDAALVMYSTLGYMLENDDVLSALRNVRRHLRPGGLLMLDVWYGPAVLTIKPSDRVSVVETTQGRMIRTATAELDARHHRCTVHYHLWHLAGDRVAAEDAEQHVVRYFFPLELELMLTQSGFALAALTAFPDLDHAPHEGSWNAFGVAHGI
jgi:SAM-dependent methyltransferase